LAIDLENKNIYLPRLYRIMEIIPETSDIKTFRLDLEDENSSHLPGQFAELFVPGVGEAPISITSSPTQKGILEFSIKRTGLVTSAIHRLNSNDRLGIRGPYGNTFPLSDLTEQNLLFIAGGIGLAPLRSLINFVLDTEKRNQFKKVTILYGARSPQDLVFKWELKRWQMRDDITFLLTVDRGDDQWKGTVGLVPNVLKENIQVDPLEWKSIICGPPIMIKFTIKALLEMGFQPPDIITTLEMRMKCGLGKCGRCNIGPYYVCKDGPVFTYQQLQNMPEEY